MEQDPRVIHQQAAQAREADKSLEALKLSDEALLAYQKQHDLLGLSEILVDRSIIYRHLADQTSDKNFLIIAEHEALAGVEIARQSSQKEALAIPLSRLGRVQEQLGKLTEACTSYQEAVENMESNPPSVHNRPAVLADMKIHLATCQYKTGDKSALDKAKQTLKDLEQAEEDSYNKNVWVSGAYMRLAEILKIDDPEKSKQYLEQAKRVIDNNPDLKIRLFQWEKLAQTFK